MQIYYLFQQNHAIPLVPQFRPLDILTQLAGKFPSAPKKEIEPLTDSDYKFG